MNYHNPGFPSKMAENYFEQMKQAGWDKEAIKKFSNDIPMFESAAIIGSFESCRPAFLYPQDFVIHEKFLRHLYGHIKTMCLADRNENLHRIAIGNGKDSMAAQRLLAQMRKKKKVAE